MEEVSRTASWAKHFDILLRDQAGLATFTEFLKKAYCQENINFWIKCEEYKMMSDDKRQDEAVRIYNEHVDLSSSEQINIDENTRLAVEKGLALAQPNLFAPAQKHIYIMLQQDSYRRFLKSELFQQATLAESQQRPFPFSGQDVKLVDTVQTTKREGKPKEDTKRRSSLIPISSRSASKRKSIFSGKDDKKIKNTIGSVETDSRLKKLKTTAALPDAEKEQKSENATSKRLLALFRRRSLGNAGKRKSQTHRSISSPTINKICLPIMPTSRPLHLSNTCKGASSSENCGNIPSVLEHDLGNSEATFHDVVQTMCLKENWNGVIKPFNDDDDFDNAKYTRATVLRRRTDGINPGGIISIREVSTAYNREHQLSGYRGDSSFASPALPPPRRINQFVFPISSANGNSDVTTDLSQKKKHHMSFSSLFPGRKSSKEKNAGRQSIDIAVVKKELAQLRREEDFGVSSSKMNKRHSLKTLIEY